MLLTCNLININFDTLMVSDNHLIHQNCKTESSQELLTQLQSIGAVWLRNLYQSFYILGSCFNTICYSLSIQRIRKLPSFQFSTFVQEWNLVKADN